MLDTHTEDEYKRAEDLVVDLKTQVLETDYEENEKRFKESGLIPSCMECGEQLSGFPLGARVSNPVCDDCREKIDIKRKELDADLPKIGERTNVNYEENTSLITPDDIAL